MKVKLGQIHEKNNIRKRITLSTFNKMWNALMVLKLNYIRCFIGCVKKKRKENKYLKRWIQEQGN